MSSEKSSSDKTGLLDIEKVRRFLPHRYPFLLIDRVEEINRVSTSTKVGKEHVGAKVRAIKNVTANEPFFMGHFPEHMIMPGVLLLEVMAQAAIFSFYPQNENEASKFPNEYSIFLVGLEEVRFRKQVVPGDRLVIQTELVKAHSGLIVFDGSIEVDGAKVAEARILSQVKEIQ